MITLLIVLTSCASSENKADELALEIRTEFIAATRLDMTLSMTADYGNRVYEYKLTYTGDASSGTIELREPASIAGLTIKLSVSGAVMEYDGASLDTGVLMSNDLTPIDAIPLLISQWQKGYITECQYETYNDNDTIAVTTQISDTDMQKVWFDINTHLPIRAEISSNGTMVIACNFEDIKME